MFEYEKFGRRHLAVPEFDRLDDNIKKKEINAGKDIDRRQVDDWIRDNTEELEIVPSPV